MYQHSGECARHISTCTPSVALDLSCCVPSTEGITDTSGGAASLLRSVQDVKRYCGQHMLARTCLAILSTVGARAAAALLRADRAVRPVAVKAQNVHLAPTWR